MHKAEICLFYILFQTQQIHIAYVIVLLHPYGPVQLPTIALTRDRSQDVKNEEAVKGVWGKCLPAGPGTEPRWKVWGEAPPETGKLSKFRPT